MAMAMGDGEGSGRVWARGGERGSEAQGGARGARSASQLVSSRRALRERGKRRPSAASKPNLHAVHRVTPTPPLEPVHALSRKHAERSQICVTKLP